MRDGWPVYGKDVASCVEAAKKLITKIESGKADKETFAELAKVNAEIIKYATSNEN